MENNIEYGMVDLGLPSGLKWAERNVGAEKIQDYGDHFMWGIVTPDTDNVCDWAHEPFNNGSSAFDETYFNEHKSEWFTENGTLKPEYDAAYVNMGGSWRMPTSAEMQELLDGTTQSVEKMNGIRGIRFISKANCNSIFMPFAGLRDGSDAYYVGYYGYAWSSSLNAGNANYSHGLYFSSSGGANVGYDYRHNGFAVRGVHE